MDAKTMDTHVISDAYFGSLNDRTNKLHIVESRQASLEEIRTDVRLWYAGFSAYAKLTGTNATQLPALESVMAIITKTFPDKATTLAA